MHAQGYPTIFLFPAGNKSNPIEYKGLTRHFDDFVAFVEDNATYVNSARTHRTRTNA
jgi:hypothetical protein